MATYRISYLDGDSYSNRGEHFIDNVVDEYEAVEYMIAYYHLDSNTIKILSVDFISE